VLAIHTAVFLGKAAIVGGYPSAYGASVGSRWLRREVDADEPLVATGGARNLAAIWDVIASTFACGMVSRYLQRFRVPTLFRLKLVQHQSLTSPVLMAARGTVRNDRTLRFK
jgi:hypothetical protein